jgi:hypothetical protein
MCQHVQSFLQRRLCPQLHSCPVAYMYGGLALLQLAEWRSLLLLSGCWRGCGTPSLLQGL